MPGRRRRGKIAALFQLLRELLDGDYGYKKREKTQCFKCQRLGHTARFCRGTVACLKCGAAHDTRKCTLPRGEPRKCANCGGPHAANYRRCDYIASGGKRMRNKKKSRGAATHEEASPRDPEQQKKKPPTAGPSSHPRGKGEPDRGKEEENAVTALKAAMAEEREAMQAALDDARRQIGELKEELRRLKKADTAPGMSSAETQTTKTADTVATATQTAGVEMSGTTTQTVIAVREVGTQTIKKRWGTATQTLPPARKDVHTQYERLEVTISPEVLQDAKRRFHKLSEKHDDLSMAEWESEAGEILTSIGCTVIHPRKVNVNSAKAKDK